MLALGSISGAGLLCWAVRLGAIFQAGKADLLKLHGNFGAQERWNGETPYSLQ
jgi:hypothetical protein